ncbi:histidine triad (HIT) nucleotide-binding protein [Halorhabdus tiamatea SARL4B]|uniref:Histidine triad (HIT) nucleotide-binding protein n=1 Tax=Halorhabdus tiamatea SARL4B TaxID=1033806 RepID=S6CU55_9EURY|nr:histidine triad (HIT) nucleotide-binding protein [Halorhabdus tiamatea SARL4B]
MFCSIVEGELPSHTVHETADALAFLDANPLARGHTLVVPKDHHERLADVPSETATGFYEALHDVVPAVEAAVDAPATTVAVNNGEPAGQEVPHVHAHVIPRFPDDDAGPVHALFARRPRFSDAEQDAIAEEITINI